jgi:hypothetical protein
LNKTGKTVLKAAPNSETIFIQLPMKAHIPISIYEWVEPYELTQYIFLFCVENVFGRLYFLVQHKDGEGIIS